MTSQDLPSDAKALKLQMDRRFAFQRALLDLTRSNLSDLNVALRNITRTAARTLGVERVGIWFFESPRESIVCPCLYKLSLDEHVDGGRLSADEFPLYFREIAQARTIAASDAASDLRTSEFAADYLPTERIVSMLDVPIRCESELVGIVCHEQVGEAQEWTTEECEFAASIADLVALALETSRRKDAEAKLRDLNQSLEERVRIRTQELNAANAELEAFSLSVSHDLRQPLRVIEGFASMLHDAHVLKDHTTARDNLATIMRNARVMSDLMDGYLSLSRVGRAATNQIDVDLDALANGVAQDILAGPTGGNTSIQIAKLGTVVGDRSMFRQLLFNLIANASKLTHSQPTVEIEVGCTDTEHGEPTWYVRDNGPGIAVEDQNLIFNLFQRLPAAAGVDGTGLRLAIARRIVERHGGRIWAESTPGQGACFLFTLQSQKTGDTKPQTRKGAPTNW
ncbi:MAG: signal transduction histidine kinase [Hyphomicrobiaceae bacterium]|jgi:signal transduction histidine kinase